MQARHRSCASPSPLPTQARHRSCPSSISDLDACSSRWLSPSPATNAPYPRHELREAIDLKFMSALLDLSPFHITSASPLSILWASFSEGVIKAGELQKLKEEYVLGCLTMLLLDATDEGTIEYRGKSKLGCYRKLIYTGAADEHTGVGSLRIFRNIIRFGDEEVNYEG